MGEDLSNNNTKDFFKEIKQQRKGFAPQTVGIKSDDSELCVNPVEIAERWQEHYSKD